MSAKTVTTQKAGFGTAPVFFTAISTILGAILFLRFGMAVGTLGFWGVFTIIILGHLITMPTALAISELATNTRVEGGGEYFIISRSFGLKIGSTIGIALYFSQAISIAFYIIAFTEAFEPLFTFFYNSFGFELPRQAISIPALLVLAFIVLRKGADMGVKALYFIVAILFLSLLAFFMGKPIEPAADTALVSEAWKPAENFGFFNGKSFFVMFAICFPAFTGMTAGVGLSGDLRNPSKSIPIGTILATVTGMIIYFFVIWKLSVSAPQDELLNTQLVMGKIAIGGAFLIPLGLAAATISSSLGSVLVAPRTLQALAYDKSFPVRRINLLLAKGKGKNKEPVNASIVSLLIAFVFVLLGDVDAVAQIISMFFLITYGTLCLISFLNHFGSAPSYRPKFRSKWYFSLMGFILSIWVMFKINPFYTILASVVIVLLYLLTEHFNKDEKGLVNIVQGALFQLNRKLQIYLQKHHQTAAHNSEWRPAAVCVSANSFERRKVLDLMRWISYKHGFGTYFHYIENYYSRQSYLDSKAILNQLLDKQGVRNSGLYIDTMISPSYTSAITQIIQSPSISGMENNMVVFEFDKSNPEEINRIIDNIGLIKAGDFDLCIFALSHNPVPFKNGIHIWIRPSDVENTNLMILLGYILLAHPDWKKSRINIFNICKPGTEEQTREELRELIETGRLPITFANIEMLTPEEDQNTYEIIAAHSGNAGLTLLGFREEVVKHQGDKFFSNFYSMGDVLFINSSGSKEIK